MIRQVTCAASSFASAGTAAVRGRTAFALATAAVADHAAALAVAGVLVEGPPVTEAIGFFAGAFAQQEEIVAGAEARVFQEHIGAFAAAPWQALLHIPDLADRQGETFGHSDAQALFADQLMGGFLHRRDRRHAAILQLDHPGRQRRPEQGGKEEGRGNGLALLNAQVGVAQGVADQLVGVIRVVLEGRGAVFLDVEIQLGGETHRPQHAHRVFLVALGWIADQADQVVTDVVYAIGVIENALGAGIVIQRIDGEVAALGVVFQAAVNVVAQDAAAFVARRQVAVLFFIAFGVIGAEGGDFDDLAAEVHVHQLETAADYPRVTELGAYLFGRGAGGDVEILGIDIQQQVAHAATDQIGLIAGLLQTFDHAGGIATDFPALDRVLAAA